MSDGGKRPNSGTKQPMSTYGEKTSAIRVSKSIGPEVLVYLAEYKKLVAATSGAMLNMPQALPNPPTLPRQW